MISLNSIHEAAKNIEGILHKTPLVRSTYLGGLVGVNLFLKCENFQKTGSFKVRGALNKIKLEILSIRSNGVVAVSAGNHAQSLAFAAGKSNIKCTVVMPEKAVQSKIDACKGYGADVILKGTVFDAFNHAIELSETNKMTFVHPFDDEKIIAGQATVGLEILNDLQKIDKVIVQIGGGGLASGVAAFIKQKNPDIKFYGIEPEGAKAMKLSFEQGKPVKLKEVNTIADGLGAPMAGDLTYKIIKKYYEDVIVVTDDEIKNAMNKILLRTKMMCEPAGAASVAGLLSGRIPITKNENVVCILSGGNIDLSKLCEYVNQ